jgi:hypothetical protein
MSEFQEKLQVMKDHLEDTNTNPALIAAEDVVDEEDEGQLPFEDNTEYQEPEFEKPTVQHNEHGHRKRKTLRDKHTQILAENRAKDAQLQQAMAYIQEQERRLAEANARAEQSAHNSNIYYESSLDNDEQRVLSELEFAEESGETRKKIELQKRLAEIAAQKQTLLLSKSLNRQQPQQYQEPVYQQYNQPPPQQEFREEPVNEYYEEWLDKHAWADQNSPEFDQDLYREVNELAIDLNKRLKFNNQVEMIGSRDYYNALSNIMNERYGIGNSNSNKDNYNDNNNINNYNDYDNHMQSYEVAPVTKKGTSMADRYIANRQASNGSKRPGMSLTQDQKELARKMAPALSKYSDHLVSVEESEAIYIDTARKKPWAQRYY